MNREIDMERLPFICERWAVSHYEDGFILGGREYKKLEDLLKKKVYPDKDYLDFRVEKGYHKRFGGFWVDKVGHFTDRYRRKIVHLSQRVPLFDEHDAKYDFRCSNWFYFVKDFKAYEVASLVAYFGTEHSRDWDWVVYENIKNHDGSKIEELTSDQRVFL